MAYICDEIGLMRAIQLCIYDRLAIMLNRRQVHGREFNEAMVGAVNLTQLKFLREKSKTCKLIFTGTLLSSAEP